MGDFVGFERSVRAGADAPDRWQALGPTCWSVPVSDFVNFERRGRAGVVTLDRPQALNALDRDMCVAIHAELDRWADDPGVVTVVLRGAGGRAFCAGGDVAALYRAGPASDAWERFFSAEYALDYRIATYPKPVVALADGITMGGGVGLSIHARFRVATETTLWAMPETGIGAVPDVGTTYALPRLPGAVGTWAVLTGARLDGPDCLAAGIATHFLPGSELDPLVDALAEGVDPAPLLAERSAAPGPSAYLDARPAIDSCFAGPTIEAILEALDRLATDWAGTQRDRILAMSPTSTLLALRMLRRGASLDLAGALTQEYRAFVNLKHSHDVHEGIRAQLVDKDRNPRWRPATLAEVRPEDLDRLLSPPATGDLTLANLATTTKPIEIRAEKRSES